MKCGDLILSEESKKQLEEIKKKIDEDFKELWNHLDEVLEGTGFTHEDVCGFYPYCYVMKDGHRYWLFEEYTPKNTKQT